jgi:hypothetical protein
MPQRMSIDAWDKLPDAQQTTLRAHGVQAEDDPGLVRGIPQMLADVLSGAGKGAADTATSVIDLVPGSDYLTQLGDILGGRAAAAMYGEEAVTPKHMGREDREQFLQPTNTAERVGKGIEQVGEFILPGAATSKAVIGGAARMIPNALSPGAMAKANKAVAIGGRMVGDAAQNAGVALAQGDDNVDTEAAIGAGAPLVGAGLESLVPLIRNPIVARTLPYLVAALGSSTMGGVTPLGIGAGLGGFGLMQGLTKQAIKSPQAIPKMRRAVQVGSRGVGRVAAGVSSQSDDE